MIVIRHGERLDDINHVTDEERKEPPSIENELDIPLSRNGKQQAIQTG